MPDPEELDELRNLARFPYENPNPVLRASLDGKVEFANAAAQRVLAELGCASGRVPEVWPSIFHRAQDQRRAQEVELKVSDRYFTFSITPIDDANYLYVYGHDVTKVRAHQEELIMAKEAAVAASQAKSAFLANMSHELRTPLNAIIGYSDLLCEECEDTGQDDLLQDLVKIRTAGRHLLALINDILDLSKVEAGKAELQIEDVDMPSLVKEVVATVTPLVEKRGNTLETRLDAKLGQIRTDPTRVRQILLNLLSNASKFTERGKIILAVAGETDKKGRWLAMSVTDTGIGMTEEQVARVFQPFMQADSSTTRQYGGTGLGLAITARFSEMLGGGVSVTSKLDEGSTFSVRLPLELSEDQRSVPPAPAPRRRPSSGAPKPLVLTVDDDPTVLELLQRFLSADGFQVVPVSDGAEALEKAQELNPAAITLDVMMPSMDGWSVLANLKRDPRTRDIPVFMLTIVDEKNVGLALGAADYLTKPIDKERLLAVLNEHLERSPREVLIVDDDEDVRAYTRRALEADGCIVREAADGHAALENVAEKAPGMILLDLMMPGMDGFQVVERLRQNERWRRIPVVVLTAMDLSVDERQRLQGQVKKTLHKHSIAPTELASVLRRAVLDRD